jgi:hypothetical protein
MFATITEITERVQKGVKFLDEHIANWVDGIDVLKLELDNSCNCILGQLFSTYANGIQHCFPVVPMTKKCIIARTLGFDVSTYHPDAAVHNEYDALEKEWIQEIQKRKEV